MSKPCPCDRVGATEAESCWFCWRWYYDQNFRVQHGGAVDRPSLPTRVYRKAGERQPIDRPNRCKWLLCRVEFQSGCNGWLCKHECEKSLPAIPGGYCQTCTSYVDSGEPF